MRFCKTSMLVLMTVTTFFVQAGAESNDAQAGPLMDWLFKRCKNRQTANYYPQQAAVPGCTSCTQTCNRVVASYVPYTAYRTCYEQVPVTYYRRTSSTDPCTGCTITCNKPCTTYRTQAKRVPYTAYRTVYRTETVTTPVTQNYAQPACSTCPTPATAYSAPVTAYSAPTSGCSTCSGGATAAPQGYGYQAAPQGYQAAPQGYQSVSPATYTPIPSYNSSGGVSNSSAPADSQPSLTPGGFTESNVTNYPTPADPTNRTDTRSVIKDLQDQYRDYQNDSGIELRSPDNSDVNVRSDHPASTRQPYSAQNRSYDRNQGNRVRGMQQSQSRTASHAPVQQRWSYSPRLASHRSYDSQRESQRTNRGFESNSRQSNSSQSRTSTRSQSRGLNEGWSSGN